MAKLEVRNLTISFRTNNGAVRAVRDISFDLNEGETLAIAGESGSGKTTIRRYAMDRIQSEGQKIKIIAPRSIDKARLTTSAICDAIIQDCSAEKPKRTLEAKSRQVEKILTNSSRAGYNHVLMIEEAHDLSIPTLKYLKRFWELEDGFKKLLAIVLIGQTEMKAKLEDRRNIFAVVKGIFSRKK